MTAGPAEPAAAGLSAVGTSAAAASAAFAEPEVPVPARWVAAVSLANVGAQAAWFGPIQVLLALQAAQLYPHHKTAVFGLVTGFGAAVSVVSNPLFGALSDRTTSRFGRRLPWVAGGVFFGFLSLAALAWAPNVAVMTVAWCGVQASINAAYAALSASIPDQVPRAQRGTVSGWVGLSQTGGVVVGTALAAESGGVTAGYLACAILAVGSAVPYLLLRRDHALPADQRPPFRLLPFVRSFWINPVRHRDFGWGFATRFLMKLANAIGTLYLLFYLQDQVHYANPASGVLILTAVYAATVLATAVTAGLWSDHVGRRKPFVLASGLVMAVASGVLAVWPTWFGAVLAALVFGIGFGGYASVDFALLTEVLPTASDRGKDLGIINIADALPQVLAPAVAAPIVAYLGGYPALYAVSALVALAGGVLVQRIRAVR
jgi:MFS family permease